MIYPYPLKIAGVGRYLPKHVVSNSELEDQCGLYQGWCEEKLGISERRWVEDETHSFMGAEASKEAIKNANLDLLDIDLIINASMSFECKVPDGGPLIQRWLGLENSGIPCITIQSSCQSFMAALDMCTSLIATGRYRNILIVSSEVMSSIIDNSYPEAYTLFGDGAGAVVVRKAEEGENSYIHKSFLQTYGSGADYMQSLYGLTAFHKKLESHKDIALQIDIESFNRHGIKYVNDLIGKLFVADDMNKIELVVPQQISKDFFENLALEFSKDKIVNITNHLGFCGAASYQMALYEAVETGKLKRNDRFAVIGFGAGLSIGGMILTY